MDCIYLNLRKAFNKVPHKRLLWKLETIGGLKGELLRGMEDFLKDREIRTVIRDQESAWKSVLSQVPQGSVLVPVMFAVYINDMTERIDNYINLFADNAKLLIRVQKKNEDYEVL